MNTISMDGTRAKTGILGLFTKIFRLVNENFDIEIV